MLALGEFPLPFVGVFLALVILVGVAALCGLGFLIQKFLRDAVRMGRERIPWGWILIIVALFSGAGWWLAGPWGLLGGLPLLMFFGIGRFLARKRIVCAAQRPE